MGTRIKISNKRFTVDIIELVDVINVLNVLISVLHGISHPPFPPEDDEEEFDIGHSMNVDDQYNLIQHCIVQLRHLTN